MINVTGLINLHKPAGMTSRSAVDIVAHVAKTKRVGHAGTLDPLATGVLVVCLGWTTRLASYVQQQRKRYRGEFLLGQRSDTDDVTGRIEQVDLGDRPTRRQVLELLPAFTGLIAQVPPAYSAVHVAGQRAYARARRGEKVELRPRKVVVHRLELTAYDFPRLELVIECGSGTYIRSLGRDLGNTLGCGAVMSALVREAVGRFEVADAVAPEELTLASLASHLLPPQTAVSGLPQHVCTAADLLELSCGRVIPMDRPAPAWQGSPVALVGPDESLWAIGEYRPERGGLQPRHVFVTPNAP